MQEMDNDCLETDPDWKMKALHLDMCNTELLIFTYLCSHLFIDRNI